MEPSGGVGFTEAQSEVLQNQVREFKLLLSRYKASNISALAEMAKQQLASSNKQQLASSTQGTHSTTIASSVKTLQSSSNLTSTNAVARNQAPSTTAPVQTIHPPAQSWQCFNSLLFTGPPKLVGPDGSLISMNAAVSFSFSEGILSKCLSPYLFFFCHSNHCFYFRIWAAFQNHPRCHWC